LTDSAGEPIAGYTFDESERFKGDSTAWTPVWRDGRSLHHHVGRAVRLEIEISNGRLFAIRGSFKVLTGYECRRLEAFEEIPPETPGF
jgi:hypothetical protein